jgi:hypothetical protein
MYAAVDREQSWLFRRYDSFSWRRSGLGSGGEIGHQLYKEFGARKLDGVDFQSVPTDEAQDAGYGFWRLDAARAAQEQTQASGQNADAKNEDGEMDLRKREFPLFLPDVDDRGDKAGQEAYLARVPCHRVRGRC